MQLCYCAMKHLHVFLYISSECRGTESLYFVTMVILCDFFKYIYV